MKIAIVDEKDNLIGYKEKKDIIQSDIGRVSALWITNSSGQILLAKRKMDKKFDPGKWSPAVSGTVEKGETYIQNIRKEAQEELGIKGHSFEKWQKLRISSEHNYFVQIFKVSLDWNIKQFKPCEKEIQKIKWFHADKLIMEVANKPEKFTPAVPLILDLTEINGEAKS